MQFELPFGLGKQRVSGDESLAVGGQRVPLHLVRNRRARRYVLRLARDGSARLTIPRGGSAGEAKRFAERNLAWLEKQLLRHAAQPVRSAVWADGTEILYRGERVRLVVSRPSMAEKPKSASASERACELVPDNCSSRREETQTHLESAADSSLLTSAATGDSCPSASGPFLVHFDSESVPINGTEVDLRPPVEKYLRRMATQELTECVFELAALHQSAVQRVSVRNQRSRWGSCSRRGTISLNWRLVQTPVFVRDYIILHELAHLKEMNHSARFWREVARLCPEFEQAECWLKQHAELLR